MEPRTQAPNSSPEMGAYTHQETSPSIEVTPQAKPEMSSERPAPQEMQPAGPAQAPASLPMPQTLQPQPAQQAAPLAPASPLPADSNPLVAADEEVIEKEWVDKAKKIVAQTKDDPYQQEKEVSKLQADYLKKRYGKEVKLVSD